MTTSEDGRMKSRVILLLILICIPVWGQSDELINFSVKAEGAWDYGDQRQSVALIQQNPALAKQAFEHAYNWWVDPKMIAETRNASLWKMNLYARVLDTRLGDASLVNRLRQEGVEAPFSFWIGTPLEGQPNPSQGPYRSLEDRRVLGLLDLAIRLGNFKLVNILAAEVKARRLFENSNPGQARFVAKMVGEFGPLMMAAHAAQGDFATVEELGQPVLAANSSMHQQFPIMKRKMLYTLVLLTQAAHESERPELFDQRIRKTLALAEQLQGDRTDASTDKAFYFEAQMDRFLLETLAFQRRLQSHPDLEVETGFQEHDRIWKLFPRERSDDPMNPMEWKLVSQAVRFWGGWLASAGRQQSYFQGASTRFDQDLTLFNEQLKLAVGRIQSAFNEGTLNPNWVNFELFAEAFELMLDVAQRQRLEGDLKSAEATLGMVAQQGLPVFDAMLGLPLNNIFTGEWKIQSLPTDQVRFINVKARYLAERARLDQAQGKPSAGSAAHFRQALQLYEAGGDYRAWLELASWLPAWLLESRPSGWQTEACSLAASALERSKKLAYRPAQIAALINLAELENLGGDKSGAAARLKEAVGLVEDYLGEVGGSAASARQIRERYRRAFDLLAELQVAAGNAQQALATLDKAQQVQSVASLDLSRLTLTDPGAQKAQQLQARTRALEKQLQSQKALPAGSDSQAKIAQTSQLLAQNKAEFIKTLDELRRKLGPGYSRFLSIKPMEFARLQKSVPADTALLQVFYTPQGEQTYLFVITQESFKVHSTPVSGKELAKLVRQYRRAVTRPTSDDFDWNSSPLKEPCLKLHALLIDPVEADLAGKKVLAVVPGGVLNYLPFHALAREQAGQPQFLAERMQVVTLTRTSDLQQLSMTRAPATGRLVAFGNPDGSLPAAAAEVNGLKSLFPQAAVFIQAEATEEKLMSGTPGTDFLHLATHGVLDSQNPDNSYLVMAGGSLTRYEIIDGLDLGQARLVTLSACETLLGETSPGDEVTSIAESFWAAGSPAIVASLWKVADDSTSKLMMEFYGRLKKGEPVGAALQGAQLALIQNPKTRHPFFWSPFVLWGDWR